MTQVSPIAYKDQNITVLASVKTLVQLGVSQNDLNLADVLQITVNAGSDVNFLCGDGTPTATFGHTIVSAGDRIVEGKVNINKMKLIGITGTATVSITLYRL